MTRIEYERLSGITYEQELEILAEVYRLALESYRKRMQKADEPDATSVRNTKGVGHVDQRPD
jgi:hypothetical protein